MGGPRGMNRVKEKIAKPDGTLNKAKLKQLMGHFERVEKQKAIGLFYNVPNIETSLLVNKLLDEHRAIHIRGTFADCQKSLKNRLAYQLKIKNFDYDMLPAATNNKALVVSDADFVGPSYATVFETLHKLNIPLLLLMKDHGTLDKVRRFFSFNHVLTIEIDYSLL